jgi:wyosine [tRNA(Phe)-imidazoG37] synthetase (radical SAM superfamily)
MDGAATGTNAPLTFRDHPRRFENNRYIYAVLSRRARGISIGVNLNPDKVCNFACIYCQVDRTAPPGIREVDEGRLLRELREMLLAVRDGSLLRLPRFARVPVGLHRVVDVAFSGDGEPTTYPRFREVVEATADLLDELGLSVIRLTLLTNASLLDRPRVREALTVLDRHGGEIWAKLDAGTEEDYRRLNATSVRFERVLDNIRDAGRTRPLVIQSLFTGRHGKGPEPREVAAYVRTLSELRRAGCRLQRVQVTTVARRPPDPAVTALSPDELEVIARAVREQCPGLPVETYGEEGGPA